MYLRKSLLGLMVLLLVGCTQVHSEADARERANKAFEEFTRSKTLDSKQFKEPRIIYNSDVEVWEAYFEWKGPPEVSNNVNVLIDKYGRAEVHSEKP